jgi:Domain of unknown function (DUF2017)
MGDHAARRVTLLRRQRVRRTRSGAIRVDLPVHEKELLRHVLPQLRELLTVGSADDRTRRLFPTAFPDDPDAEAEYRAYMHGELVTSRLEALGTIESTLEERNLTEEQAVAWMQSINSVRLVLGSLLDVTEDIDVDRLPEDHPEIEGFVLYGYLSLLLDELVRALSA